MPPKRPDREAEAVAAEDAASAKLSRALFDEAVDARLVSRVRPSSLKELVPSKALKRSDCKDIHKRSSIKKSRYMTIFPGQLATLKEGRLGSLAKLDTQNPVMYIEYPGLGRLKLVGTIVRSRATRYFSLNIKSRDRLQLEDWFDSAIVFSRYSWVGDAESNPEETPLPFPEQLKHVQAAAAATEGEGEGPAGGEETDASGPAADASKPPPTPEVNFAASVAAEEGAKPVVSAVFELDDDEHPKAAAARAPPEGSDGTGRSEDDRSADVVRLDDSSDDSDAVGDGGDATEARSNPSSRPRRASARAATYRFDEGGDSDFEEEEEEEERVFRGRVTATVAKEAAPMKEAAPKRRASAAAPASTKAGAPAKRARPASPPTGRGEGAEGGGGAEGEANDGAKESAKQKTLLGFLKPAAAVAAPPKRKFVVDSDDSDDEDADAPGDEDASDDSDEEMEEEDDDSDFEA
jgi:hypothetical protein